MSKFVKKGQASASGKKDKSPMSEEANARDVLEQMKRNADMIKEGKTNPRFAGIPELVPDSSSPLAPAATASSIPNAAVVSSLAEGIVGTVPTAEKKLSSPPPFQPKKEIKDMAIKAASKYGVSIEEIHIEDLASISHAEGIPLTQREVQLYVRGVAKTYQISMTTTLGKLVDNMENLLMKNQKAMQSATDSNKLMVEKMTLLGSKVDGLGPIIGSTVTAEHNKTRSEMVMGMNSIENSIKALTMEEDEEEEVSASSNLNTEPGTEDIKTMCLSMGCPETIAASVAAKYQGLVTWQQHRAVMSGAIPAESFKEMLLLWKQMLEGKAT